MPSRSSSHAEPYDPQRHARLIARNVRWSLGAQTWLLVLTIALAPVLIHRLGTTAYGLYALIVAMVGYLGLLDFGLGIATVKYVSEHLARRDRAAVERAVGTALTAYLAIGFAGGSAIALAGPPLAGHLGASTALVGTARSALPLVAAGFTIAMPLALVTAIPTALQRLDLVNRVNALLGTATVAGSAAVVLLGGGLLGVIGVMVAVNAVALACFTVLTARLLWPGALRPRIDRTSARFLFSFGIAKFVNQLATQAVLHVDKFLVAVLASISAVTFYVVPVTAAQTAMIIVGTVAGPFLPAASGFHAVGDMRRFGELYVRVNKLVAALVLPLAALLIVFAEPILRVWVGPSFAHESADPLRVLAAGYAVNAFSTVPALACDSMGRPRVTTAFSVLSGVLNISLSLVLIPRFGILGASFAILINSLVLVPIFVVYVHRRVLGTPVRTLLSQAILRPVGAAAAAVGALLCLLQVVRGPATLVLAAAAALVFYGATCFALRLFDAAELAALRGRLGGLAPGASTTG